VVLKVADDGAGIAPGRLEAALAAGAVGIASCRERVEALAAACASRRGRGRAPVRWPGSRSRRPAGQESPVLEMAAMGHDPPVPNGSGTGALTRRVYIADDHEGYRSGVARLVAEHPALEVVGEAADGEQALAGIIACQPDVALLDVRMPGMNGIEVCRRIHADGSAPHVRIVLITGTPDPILSTQAAEAGAVALLGKETPPNTIAAQLLAAAEGRVGWSVE
jgi:two-component system nitrate/nitrite response regulator NarL